MIAATQLRVGYLILYNGKPHRVATAIHRTPGNPRGFVQPSSSTSRRPNQKCASSRSQGTEKGVVDEHRCSQLTRPVTSSTANTESYDDKDRA